MKTAAVLTAVVTLSGLASSVVSGQHGMPGGTPMTFFVTSEPIGNGGGAGGRTWRAYLSTQATAGQPAVNARDRIGTGPGTTTTA